MYCCCFMIGLILCNWLIEFIWKDIEVNIIMGIWYRRVKTPKESPKDWSIQTIVILTISTSYSNTANSTLNNKKQSSRFLYYSAINSHIKNSMSLRYTSVSSASSAGFGISGSGCSATLVWACAAELVPKPNIRASCPLLMVALLLS
jgi:hypothetical protein